MPTWRLFVGKSADINSCEFPCLRCSVSVDDAAYATHAWCRKPRAGFCMEVLVTWKGGSSTVEVLDTDNESDLELPAAAPTVVRSALSRALDALKQEMIAMVAMSSTP